MYSIKETAKLLGTDNSHVRRLLASGELDGIKLARKWIVLDLTCRSKRKPKTKRNKTN